MAEDQRPGTQRRAVLRRVELPAPLNNCPTVTVLTSVSFRDNSLRSRRCCGGHRSLGSAELHAGTCDRTLVHGWLDADGSSIEQSSCSDLKKQAPLNKIKKRFFSTGRGAFSFSKKMGGAFCRQRRHPGRNLCPMTGIECFTPPPLDVGCDTHFPAFAKKPQKGRSHDPIAEKT